MGTMIQALPTRRSGLSWRGLRGPPERPCKGCNDLLSITQPANHRRNPPRAYLEAGADIIETNSFNATAVSLADYGLAEGMSLPSTRPPPRRRGRAVRRHDGIAYARATHVSSPVRSGRPTRPPRLSPDVNNPSHFAGSRSNTLEAAYYDQVDGLMAGGVDLLMPETTFDTLNLKAALFAIERWFAEHGRSGFPVIASLTITDQSGRTLSGQTVEAAWTRSRTARRLRSG